jgi:hypothetical protein
MLDNKIYCLVHHEIVELEFWTPPGVNPHIYDMPIDMQENSLVPSVWSTLPILTFIFH